MTTLNDVAKRANVSKMTVSRAINHPEQVTDELKELVFAAMKELNYRPNTAAKALVNNRTLVIKLFILEEMDVTEPYYMNLLTGIAQGLDKEQYSLQLVTKNNFDLGLCDGYIMTGVRQEDYAWINGANKPVVLFGENDRGYDFIDTNNKKGVSIATEYAAELGYEHFVFVGIDVNETFERSREAGFLEIVQHHQKDARIIRFENRSRYSAAYVEENWEQFEHNTVFICSSDRLAIGVERAIQKMNGSIPKDFGIIGHDGVFLDQIAFPRLTTIRQPVVEMGEACAKMILKKIKEKGKSQGKQFFDSKLIPRETTRKPSKEKTSSLALAAEDAE